MQESSKKRNGGLEELRRRLDERGGHMTRQRTAVYEYLSSVDHHPTAEEVFLNVKLKVPKISLATVYKNLEALVACEAISKLSYGDGSARYDIRTDHHYHTRCLNCGRMWDLEAALGEPLLKELKPQTGFNISGFRLELLGHCEDCRP